MKILFMGTPLFAVRSLAALRESGNYELAVITRPDKPKGRGYTVTPPEVKVYAEEHRLPVYQPTTLKDEAFAALLADLAPELIVVAAYGMILPKSVLDYPEYGCINVHGSLLPEYRGAAPIQRAILDGKKQTGITIMRMSEGLDTGDMLGKAVVPIEDDDTFQTLLERMADRGAELLVSLLPKLEAGELVPEKQDDRLATYAQKIGKEDCMLDFSLPAGQVYDRIRGLSPFPLAAADLNGVRLKLISSRLSERRSDAAAGTVVAVGEALTAVCGDGQCIEITEVLPAGKKRMPAADYLRGSRTAVGAMLLTPGKG